MATATQGPRPPRYPNERPLQDRTIENDNAALEIAQLACHALGNSHTGTRKRRKLRKPNAGDDEYATVDDPRPRHQNALNLSQGLTASSSCTNPGEPSTKGNKKRKRTCEEDTTSPQSDPIQPLPELRLRLNSMYDGTGPWPKKDLASGGSEQPSWANIGFPNDESLVVEDFQRDTHLDPKRVHIMQLSEDICSIKSQPATNIAHDGLVDKEVKHNRTIENFRMWHGFLEVCKVTFSDCRTSQPSYSTCKTSRKIEKQITEEVGKPPSLEMVQWVAAYVILATAGQLGGRSQDYWIKARDLAQQQLLINPGWEDMIRIQMGGGTDNDPAFAKMLDIVKRCIKVDAFNPYFQSKRDKHAVARDMFSHIKNKDIVMVLDAEGEVILFQLSGAFGQFFWSELEHQAVGAIETYSTLHAVPIPDMTRNGLHYIDWLVKHPELDFRNAQNDPRTAKSGLYHFGVRGMPNDPNGLQDPKQTRDIRRAIPYMMDDKSHRLKQLKNLRYGAFGVCTEMLRHVFGLLDPALLSDYDSVAKEVAKLRHLDDTKTRSQGQGRDDPFVLRALLINMMTYENHRNNTSDWRHGFVGQVTMGDYKGGDLLVRELGLRIESKPESLLLFRGRELRHATTEWTGKRFVVVSSVQESVKRWAFRRLGRPVPPDDIPGPEDDCLDLELEDEIPEARPHKERVKRALRGAP